jgi:phage replication-related protein YjqB (UPF0714/DUF867 family)
MTRAAVSIKQARSDQDDLRKHRERASVRPDFAATLGLDVGRQAILRRDADRFALYTLVDAGAEPSADTVRMGEDGRGRLGGADEEQFDGCLDGVAVDPAATEDEARRGEKLLELLDDDDAPDGLIVLAPHGGDIEQFTDSQAEHLRSLLTDLGVSCWRCKGWKPNGGAAARWHITSTDISSASFPRLATVDGRGFRHAVSFHGFATDDDARPDVLVGGGAPDALKRVVRAVIAAAVAGAGLRVEIAGPDDPLGGDEDRNLVNRLTANRHNGIQIEQRLRARTGTLPDSTTPRWQAIAAAVADVYRVILTPPG